MVEDEINKEVNKLEAERQYRAGDQDRTMALLFKILDGMSNPQPLRMTYTVNGTECVLAHQGQNYKIMIEPIITADKPTEAL